LLSASYVETSDSEIPIMRVHHLRHVEFEGLGSIEPWLLARGHTLTTTCEFRSEPLPTADELDVLIVMGGPMGVNDEAAIPWIAAEKRLIRQCIAAGKKVLGVCLGAQLIASALGARVYRNAEREIGWFEIRRTPEAAAHPLGSALPQRYEVFHWHGDTFDLPAGAVHLAESAGCKNQAFAVGSNVLAFQFHMEMTPEWAAKLIDGCRDELTPAPYVQNATEIAAPAERFAAMNERMSAMLTRLFDGS
jgi:GMP synthase-like glutamine amidotransferase